MVYQKKLDKNFLLFNQNPFDLTIEDRSDDNFGHF